MEDALKNLPVKPGRVLSETLRNLGVLTELEDRFVHLVTDPLSPTCGRVGLSYWVASGGTIEDFHQMRRDGDVPNLSGGSNLMKQEHILARIKQIVDQNLSDPLVDSRLGELILQSEDLSVALKGIQEYNKLKNRIVEHLDVTSKNERIPAEVAVAVARRIIDRAEDKPAN